MDIYSKSTTVEFTLADLVNLTNDATKLEVIASLLKERGSADIGRMATEIGVSLIDICERIEEAFNKEEGS